ncbi:MAG: hypothetical protein ACRCUS_03310, partial [Anaerovoracaceae bacterium]
MNNYKNKKGYYTLEAAIFLPFIIIGLLSIGYLVRVIGTVDSVNHASIDEARYQAQQAYTDRAGLSLKSRLTNRVKAESNNISDFKITNYNYMLPVGLRTGIISFNTKYEMKVKLPLPYKKTYESEDRVV